MQVSIALPVYNGMNFIEQAVESLLNQSFRDFEIIIIDDGSNDKTPEILKSLAVSDPRIKVFRNQKQEGICNALNKAISYAQGDLIARMDADDIAHPTRLEKQVKQFWSNPNLIVLGTDVELIDEQGKVIGYRHYPQSHNEILASIQNLSPFAHPSVMFRKSAFLKVGGYRKQYQDAEDYDLWLRMCHLGEMSNLPEPLLQYRIHPRQVTTSRLRNQHRAHMAARREHLGLGNYSLWYALKGKQSTLGYKYMALAYQQILLGQPRAALRYCFHALVYSPLSQQPWKFLWNRIRCTRAYDRYLWYWKKLKECFVGR